MKRRPGEFVGRLQKIAKVFVELAPVASQPKIKNHVGKRPNHWQTDNKALSRFKSQKFFFKSSELLLF
jgi:hypothetical protein